MLLATPGQTAPYALLSNGSGSSSNSNSGNTTGSSGVGSSSSIADSSNKKSTSSSSALSHGLSAPSNLKSAAATMFNVAAKLQRPILNKLSGRSSDLQTHHLSYNNVSGDSNSYFPKSKLNKLNGSILNNSETSTTTAGNLVTAATSSFNLFNSTFMRTLAVRYRNSGHESLLLRNNYKTSSNNKALTSNSVAGDAFNQNCHITSTANVSATTTTTAVSAAIAISSKTTSSILNLSNHARAHNNSYKATTTTTIKTNTTTNTTSSLSSSPPTRVTATATSLVTSSSISSTLKSPGTKIPSALFLKFYTVPPTYLHRSSVERRRVCSTDSLHEEMCHFKPIQTAPITPLKSSKYRGLILRHPIAVKKSDVSLDNKKGRSTGKRNRKSGVAEDQKPKPSSKFTHHTRYSAFVSLLSNDGMSIASKSNGSNAGQISKNRKRKAPSKPQPFARAKRSRQTAGNKSKQAKTKASRAKTKKTTTKTAATTKKPNPRKNLKKNSNNLELQTEIVTTRVSRKRKAGAAIATNSLEDDDAFSPATKRPRNANKKKAERQTQRTKIDINIRENNETTSNSSKIKIVSGKCTRKTPPLTRSRVRKMPHLQLFSK